MKGRRAM